MKLKDIIDRSILKEKGRIYSYITKFYSEVYQDTPSLLSRTPEKDTIGESLSDGAIRNRYLKHVNSCLKNDIYCDIAADILIQDGLCIVDQYRFNDLLKQALAEAEEERQIFINTLDDKEDENDIPLSPERLRDYRIYAACVKEAQQNDIDLYKQNKGGESNISLQERSVLNCLASQLGLSNKEARGLYMSQTMDKPHIETKDLVKELVYNGIVVSTKDNIYIPEEIADMIREIRGVKLERKYMRRIISNMDDKMLNMIRRRHNIQASTAREDKINKIIDNDLDPQEIFGTDIYPEGTSENEKKHIFNDFVQIRLGISPEHIQGRTISQKTQSLVQYYTNDKNESVDTISKDGYEQLLHLLKESNLLDKTLRLFNFTDSQISTATASMLIDYDIFAKDLLYMLTDDELRSLCESQDIKFFKNMNTMVLISKILGGMNTRENILIEHYIKLAFNDSVALAEKGIIQTKDTLGAAFQATTQTIFERLGIQIGDYPNPSRKKEQADIILDFDNEGLIIVECKSGKEPYSSFSHVTRQINSYYNAYKGSYNVAGMLIVANDFTEEFKKEAANGGTRIGLSLMSAQTLLDIYNGLKDKKFRLHPLMLLKNTIANADFIIRQAQTYY